MVENQTIAQKVKQLEEALVKQNKLLTELANRQQIIEDKVQALHKKIDAIFRHIHHR